MKTLKKLAEEIEQNPSQYSESLKSFKTENHILKEFLDNMSEFPSHLRITIPSLIRCLCKDMKEWDTPQTLGDLAEIAPVGTMFVTEEGGDYSLGDIIGDKIQAKEVNTGIIDLLPKETRVKWIF